MTSFAVVHGECHLEMADTAKLIVKIQLHGKVLCRFLFDVENIGVAVIAIKPGNMLFVRKDSRRYAAPFGLEDHIFVECDVLRRLHLQIAVRFDQSPFKRAAPVAAIPERRYWKFRKKPGELLVAIIEVVVMALLAMGLAVTENHHIVMAGAAEISSAVRLFGDLRRVSLHGKLQLEVTDAAGVLTPVKPMREHDRFDIVLRGRSVYQERAVLVSRRQRRKFPLPPGDLRNNDQQTDDGKKRFY